jgi:hypothetical protein
MWAILLQHLYDYYNLQLFSLTFPSSPFINPQVAPINHRRHPGGPTGSNREPETQTEAKCGDSAAPEKRGIIPSKGSLNPTRGIDIALFPTRSIRT